MIRERYSETGLLDGSQGALCSLESPLPPQAWAEGRWPLGAWQELLGAAGEERAEEEALQAALRIQMEEVRRSFAGMMVSGGANTSLLNCVAGISPMASSIKLVRTTTSVSCQYSRAILEL